MARKRNVAFELKNGKMWGGRCQTEQDANNFHGFQFSILIPFRVLIVSYSCWTEKENFLIWKSLAGRLLRRCSLIHIDQLAMSLHYCVVVFIKREDFSLLNIKSEANRWKSLYFKSHDFQRGKWSTRSLLSFLYRKHIESTLIFGQITTSTSELFCSFCIQKSHDFKWRGFQNTSVCVALFYYIFCCCLTLKRVYCLPNLCTRSSLASLRFIWNRIFWQWSGPWAYGNCSFARSL